MNEMQYETFYLSLDLFLYFYAVISSLAAIVCALSAISHQNFSFVKPVLGTFRKQHAGI